MKYECYVCDLTVSLALLRKLLVENRSKRYTIRQIRDHQWFNKNFNRTALGIYSAINGLFTSKIIFKFFKKYFDKSGNLVNIPVIDIQK